jgi:hypothetical protein
MSGDLTPKPSKFHHAQFWLCIIMTLGEFWLLYTLFYVTIPESNQRIADTMFGSYGTAWLGSIWYFFKSSAGSDNKTDLLAKAEPIKE